MKHIRLYQTPGEHSKTAVITNEDLNQRQAERVIDAILTAQAFFPTSCLGIWMKVCKGYEEFPAWPTADISAEESEKWDRFHNALIRYHKERGKLDFLRRYYEDRKAKVINAKWLTAEEKALLTPEQKRFLSGEWPRDEELTDELFSKLIDEGI